MNLNTAIKRGAAAQSRLRDLFSRARHFHLSHDRMLEERRAIYADLAGCPRWVSAKLGGYWDAQMERLYEQDLEYCSVQADGRIYSHHSASERYYGRHGISPRECCENATAQGHYWRDTDSPFFLPRELNL